MSRGLPESGQATALVLVGFVLLAIPAGLVLAQGVTTAPTATPANTVVTPTLPPANLTETPTPTPTPTDSEEPPQGNTSTLVVDDDRVDCPDAGFRTIREAVDVASKSDTVRVCAGTYPENVTIETTDVTLRADGQASIEAPGWVLQVNVSGVTIRGFEVNAISGQGGIRVAANDSLVTNNSIHGADEPGIRVQLHQHAVIRNNTIDNAPSTGYPPSGVLINGSARVVGNTIMHARAGVFIQGEGTVRGNNISQTESAVDIANGANVTVIGNTLTQNYHTGILLSSLTRYDLGKGSGQIVENRITNNRDGIIIGTAVDPEPYEFHRNVILNNANLGIHKGNFDVNDGDWPIVNATNNYWACGGPSGGLEDPETGRVANGSGDPLSAGDEQGVSNVHFDPFKVVNPASCPGGTATPTPTPTTTPTSRSTTTPTTAGTTTPGTPPETSGGSGGGASARQGTDDGGSGDTDPSSDEGKAATETGGAIATPPQSTATPSASPSPSPSTRTPTPVVEPGFGVTTWVVGVAAVVALLALRRQEGEP